MKTNLLIIFCIIIGLASRAQDHQYIYYLDGDLRSVDKAKAIIVGKGVKEDNLFRLECYTILDNKLFALIHFTDSTISDLEGMYVSFHPNRKAEGSGSFHNSEKEGLWQEWDTLGRLTDSTVYKHDKLMYSAAYSYQKNGRISFYTLKDSLQDTYQAFGYDEEGKMTSEVFFKGTKGVRKNYTDKGIGIDSLFTREEKEAEFPGGDRGWSNYLKNNLDANTPIENNAGDGTYQVIIKFVIDVDGSIKDVVPETHFGHGMEQEAIRIIKNGPKWIPAKQFGFNVRAFRRQPVTFVVSGG